MKAFIVVVTILVGVMSASAQTTVTVSGRAVDSLSGRPLKYALLALVGTRVTATTDSAGEFHFDALVPGKYDVLIQHEVLDGLGIGSVRETIDATESSRSLILWTPSLVSLWGMYCHRSPSADSGLTLGRVRWRDGEPAAGVLTSLSRPAAAEPSDIAYSSADGRFVLCGGTRGEARVVTAISDGRRVSQNLNLQALVAPSVELRLDAINPRTLGSMDLWVVAGADHHGVKGAEVVIETLKMPATTDAEGRITVRDLNPGRFVVHVRKIGFVGAEQTVEVKPGEETAATVVLTDVPVLDSVKVIARSSPPDEPMRLFEEHRKIGLGKFLSREQLAPQENRQMSEILRQFQGITVMTGKSGQAYLGSSRGVKSMSASCQPAKQDDPEDGTQRFQRAAKPCPEACFVKVFLDGILQAPGEMPNINRIDPADLEAVEYYAGGAQVPIEFNRLNTHCGVLLLHSRRYRRPK